MSVAKVIEIIAEGKSVEDAVDNGVKEAGKSIRHIRSAYVDGIQALLDKKGKVDKYRVNLKISFVIE